LHLFIFYYITSLPPRPPLFPYTTLFRSLQRLGLAAIDALLIHDLDLGYFQTEAGVEARLRELSDGGGFAALEDPKRRGEIRAIGDRKSTRLNSSHVAISYAVFCLKKKRT